MTKREIMRLCTENLTPAGYTHKRVKPLFVNKNMYYHTNSHTYTTHRKKNENQQERPTHKLDSSITMRSQSMINVRLKPEQFLSIDQSKTIKLDRDLHLQIATRSVPSHIKFLARGSRRCRKRAIAACLTSGMCATGLRHEQGGQLGQGDDAVHVLGKARASNCSQPYGLTPCCVPFFYAGVPTGGLGGAGGVRGAAVDGPVASSNLVELGLVVHDADVRVDVALALGPQVTVGALELRLLAALGAQVVAQGALPAVHLAARRAREGAGALAGRRIQHLLVVVLILLEHVVGVLDQNAGTHVQRDRVFVGLRQRQVLGAVLGSVLDVAHVQRPAPHQLGQPQHFVPVGRARRPGARGPGGRARDGGGHGRGSHRRRRGRRQNPIRGSVVGAPTSLLQELALPEARQLCKRKTMLVSARWNKKEPSHASVPLPSPGPAPSPTTVNPERPGAPWTTLAGRRKALTLSGPAKRAKQASTGSVQNPAM